MIRMKANLFSIKSFCAVNVRYGYRYKFQFHLHTENIPEVNVACQRVKTSVRACYPDNDQTSISISSPSLPRRSISPNAMESSLSRYVERRTRPCPCSGSVTTWSCAEKLRTTRQF